MAQRSIGELIVAVGGFIVWVAYFALLYGVQTAFCVVAPANWSEIRLRISGLVLTAVAVITLLVLRPQPSRWVQRRSNREDAGRAESARFLQQVSMVGAVLAVLAMLWATVPLLLLSACGTAAA